MTALFKVFDKIDFGFPFFLGFPFLGLSFRDFFGDLQFGVCAPLPPCAPPPATFAPISSHEALRPHGDCVSHHAVAATMES